MFNIEPDKKMKYNSISERLEVMDVKFFEKLLHPVFSSEHP